MRDGQVEDQAPAARLVPKVVADLQVAAPLACACRYPVLRADRVSVQPCGTGGQGQIPSSRAPWLHMSELCRFWCGRRESANNTAAALSKRAISAAGEGGEHGNL